VRRLETDELVILADVDRARAESVARETGSRVSENWQDVISADLDAVIVSTTNNWLAPVSRAALETGRHVLVEKPMARTSAEAVGLVEGMTGRGVVLQVGFNHRYHLAVRRAHDLIREGAVGDLLFARARYGHGGRPGYDQEWRMDPRIAGGGGFLDQGIHIVDILRWFFGEFTEAFGFTAAYVWGAAALPMSGRPHVEDNGFAMLRTAGGQVASFHTSLTQWKNLYCLEFFGDRGYLVVEGLGGSYGPERLVIGQRNMGGGVPDEETITFGANDDSWTEQWRAFRQAVHDRVQPSGDGHDGIQALRLVEAVYDSARSGRVTRL